MQTAATLTTERLLIAPLSMDDHAFVRELVNTEGWLRFIGNRNISDEEKAKAYIQMILDNPKISYWVVRQKEDGHPTGIVTFIQRDYLPHPDIGFAFLPAYAGKGYAYEASSKVLQYLQNSHSTILATTLPDNTSSIKLLHKLGLRFQRQVEANGEMLQLYGTEV